jgi:hypothetical protein
MSKRVKVRQQHYEQVWEKGRRPRRRVKSADARKGIRHLRVFLLCTAAVTLLLSVLLYQCVPNRRQSAMLGAGSGASPAVSSEVR